MELFYLEKPTLSRKQDAVNYINEFHKYNSYINGTGRLHAYLDDYKGWLEKLENDLHTIPNDEKVPSVTYFLVRSNDNRIVGMINIRLALNEYLRRGAGHIGYSIRPTERGKGYNKINLYLGLKICNEYGIDKVLMDAELDNIASWKTMESLGGKRVKEWLDEEDNSMTVNYEIDVIDSLNRYSLVYEPMIDNIKNGSVFHLKRL